MRSEKWGGFEKGPSVTTECVQKPVPLREGHQVPQLLAKEIRLSSCPRDWS